MRKKTLWLLGISLLFLILVTVLGIVWEDAAQLRRLLGAVAGMAVLYSCAGCLEPTGWGGIC